MLLLGQFVSNYLSLVLKRLILAILLWSLYQAIAKYLVVSQAQFCTGTFLIFKLKSIDSKDLVQLFLGGPMDIENGQAMCQMTDTFGNLIGLRGPK